MPEALKILLTMIVDVALLTGLLAVGISMIKHPEEWFFWRKK